MARLEGFHPMLLGRAKALARAIEALWEVGPCAGGAKVRKKIKKRAPTPHDNVKHKELKAQEVQEDKVK